MSNENQDQDPNTQAHSPSPADRTLLDISEKLGKLLWMLRILVAILILQALFGIVVGAWGLFMARYSMSRLETLRDRTEHSEPRQPTADHDAEHSEEGSHER